MRSNRKDKRCGKDQSAARRKNAGGKKQAAAEPHARRTEPTEAGGSSSPLEVGLRQLLQGYALADVHQRNPWEFAVKLHWLKTEGLKDAEIRRLVRQGHLLHRIETTRAGEPERRFHLAGRGRFAARSCFVLTPAGHAWASEEVARLQTDSPGTASGHGQLRGGGQAAVPVWDDKSATLYLGAKLIHHFKHDAPDQAAILRVPGVQLGAFLGNSVLGHAKDTAAGHDQKPESES